QGPAGDVGAGGRQRRPRGVRSADRPARRRRGALRGRPRRGPRPPPWPGRRDAAETLYELARDEADDAALAEVEQSLGTIDADLRRVELQSMFSGEHDKRDALVTIQAGEGGVDAPDWAEMLLRMITRWAERRGFGVEVDEFTPGSEAGISSAELIVKGRYAYGYLQAERGVHRLVRISPFN